LLIVPFVGAPQLQAEVVSKLSLKIASWSEHSENSDVFPFGSVAVAVMTR